MDVAHLFLQRATGSVTIVPELSPADFYGIIADPNAQTMARKVGAGVSCRVVLPIHSHRPFPKTLFVHTLTFVSHTYEHESL